jgi:hypothetical protein
MREISFSRGKKKEMVGNAIRVGAGESEDVQGGDRWSLLASRHAYGD